jgi:ABC-type phosphate/phosphonate transport system substrate-binding protein
MPALVLFGLPPTLDPGRARRLGQDFLLRLAAATGEPMDLRVAGSYGELAEDLAAGRIDFAWLPPLDAASLSERAGVWLLAQAERAGRLLYHSVLFCRDDADLRVPADLAGRRLAYVHRRSASGCLVTAARLRALGVTPAETIYCGSHALAVLAVAEGRADAGSTFCTFTGDPARRRVATAGWTQAHDSGLEAMRIIEITGDVPADVICAAPETRPSLRRATMAALAELHGGAGGRTLLAELFGAERFAPVDPERFAPLGASLARLSLG